MKFPRIHALILLLIFLFVAEQSAAAFIYETAEEEARYQAHRLGIGRDKIGDVAQETVRLLLKKLRHDPVFLTWPEERSRSYIKTTARREFLRASELRKNGTRIRPLSSTPLATAPAELIDDAVKNAAELRRLAPNDPARSPTTAVEAEETLTRYREWLETLSHQERQTWNLYVGESTEREIARSTGVTRHKVRSLLRALKTKFRSVFSEDSTEELAAALRTVAATP